MAATEHTTKDEELNALERTETKREQNVIEILCQ